MEEIKVIAQSLDDAITDASLQLGIPSSEMDYEVVEKGSTGFLGIGRKDVVIIARKKTAETEKQTQKKAPEKKTVAKESVKKEPAKAEEPAKAGKTVAKKIAAAEGEGVQEITDHTESESAKKEGKRERKEREITPVTPETQNICEAFARETVEKMGLEATVTSKIEEDGSLYIDVAGPEMGILIGKRGQTLDSLQYLINRVGNKNQEGYVRVKLDTEDYRSRRKATLENLAKNIASKVKRTRKNVDLEPMNPYERRIIHAVLQEDDRVTTYSEGSEPYRHVVVTLDKHE